MDDGGKKVPRAPASVASMRADRTRHEMAAARALGNDMCTANEDGKRCCSRVDAKGVKRSTHEDGGVSDDGGAVGADEAEFEEAVVAVDAAVVCAHWNAPGRPCDQR